ncbi:response regulator transcription factor [Demequina lutea]|uniref:DNA-binding NarL/FixJ family response regulator n=1 Tax=Demequina lutea TaxID=431489 RepID=A0A7Z0CIU7_9MICO|nr:response regulator transcription factor [Demequina lutea]NYI40258.1 DNA-binding NarL/FixJ family response regulator [Demequina lutea]
MTLRILIADDQALIRAGFQAIIDSTPDLEVVGLAENGEEALAMVRKTHVDVVLMDIRMPVMDGLEATSRIMTDPTLGHVKVLVLTTFELDALVLQAMRAGASGFLGKDVDPEDLLHALRVVAAGEALLSPRATRALVENFIAQPSTGDAPSAEVDVLTEREREVVVLVATGLSNDEIARRLVISPLTAKTHVSRAMTKIAARDRAQLVVFAYQSGLMSPAASG